MRWITVGVGVCLLLVSMGCATVDRNVALSKQTVTPLTVGDAWVVSAADLAEAMARAGFDRQAILQHGPAIRNALAAGGGAQVRANHVVNALFAVHGDRLYVTSRTRGTFIQRLNRGEQLAPLQPPE